MPQIGHADVQMVGCGIMKDMSDVELLSALRTKAAFKVRLFGRQKDADCPELGTGTRSRCLEPTPCQ